MRKRKGETAMSCEGEMRRKELMRKIYD